MPRQNGHFADDIVRDDDDSVLSFHEWCAKANVSESTGRRMVACGEGPVLTQISRRRFGITKRHHREWLRERLAVSAPRKRNV